MQLPKLLDSATSSMKMEYEMYVAVLNGIIAEEMVKKRSSQSTVEARVFPIYMKFSQKLKTISNIGFIEVSNLSNIQTGGVSSQLEFRRMSFERILDAQVRSDAMIAVSLLKKFRRDLNRTLQVEGMSEKKARGILRDHYMSKDMKRFTVNDRSGKRWKSENYISLAYRKQMLDGYNEDAIEASMSVDTAFLTIQSTDTSKEYVGKRVGALISSQEELNYYEIEKSVFHPNSNCWLQLNWK